MLLLAFLLTLLGFAALALALDRHHRQVRNTLPSRWRRYWLRIGGSLGLALSLTLCVLNQGWGNGVVLWFGLISAAPILIILALAYKPTLLRGWV